MSNTITIYHFKNLTKDESARLNGPDGSWDSEPRFSRYADITTGRGRITGQIMKALVEGEYSKVAVVEGDLDDAYADTQHINENWKLNANVTALPGNHRSTSVGDILEDNRTGEMYVVASIGFTKM